MLLQVLQRDLEKAKAQESLRSLSPQQKRERDTTAWAAWLNRYAQRLGREATAGTDPAERVRIMNATNPRYHMNIGTHFCRNERMQSCMYLARAS